MADGNQVENAAIPATVEEVEAPLSVREELEKAFTETVEPETTEAKTAEQRARDEQGRFARQEKTETTAKAPDKTATGQTAVATNAATQSVAPPQAGTAAVEPPQHWAEGDKAKFKEAPAELKTWLLDRHKAMEGDYTRKMQDISNFKREYEPIDQLFKPYEQDMQQRGWTKANLVNAWAQAELKLNADPLNGVMSIARSYGITPEQLVAAIQKNPNFGTQQVIQDPRVTQLQQRLDNYEKQQNQTRLSSTRTHIEQFAAATNTDGSLAHPYFDEVVENIIHLAQVERSAARVPDMQKLYDTAVWANDGTRTKLLNARDQAAQKSQAEAARTKSASARRAGSSVTGAPNGPGQAAKPAGGNSVREALLAAHDEVMGAG